MKKIITLAAAVLASFSLMADVTITLSQMTEADNNTVTYEGQEIKAKNGPVYVEVPAEGISGTVTFFGSSNKDRFLYINGSNGTERDENRKMVMSIEGASVDFTADDIAVVEDVPYLVFSTGDDFKFKKFQYTYEGGEIAPLTDPVGEVTISGPVECFAGQTITLSASTDVKANAFKWAVNGEEQEGANTAKFDFAPEAAGTFQIVCSAKNDNNEDFVASEAFAVEVTERVVLEQVTISESTIWDWSKASAKKEIKLDDKTTPAKNEQVLLANIIDINNNDEFNSQALLFSGEYPIRDSKYCQGAYIEFNTTVAGYVQVEFSNTGGKVTDGVSDRPKRYVAVNGTVNLAVGSDTGNKVESAYIAVPAGKVNIAGAFDDGTPQYIRIYKITFGVGEIPTAIENTKAAQKAVKVVRNGQLFIEKGGVLYNAQGAVVK